MASSQRGKKDKITGPQFSKKTKEKEKEISQSPSSGDQCVLHLIFNIQLENETKITRASSFTVPFLCEKAPCLHSVLLSVFLSVCL